MQQSHFLFKLYNRYYPKSIGNTLNLLSNAKDCDLLDSNRKAMLTDKYLKEGEYLLSKDVSKAIEYFKCCSKPFSKFRRYMVKTRKSLYILWNLQKSRKRILHSY